jgi:hypothetical protein
MSVRQSGQTTTNFATCRGGASLFAPPSVVLKGALRPSLSSRVINRKRERAAPAALEVRLMPNEGRMCVGNLCIIRLLVYRTGSDK